MRNLKNKFLSILGVFLVFCGNEALSSEGTHFESGDRPHIQRNYTDEMSRIPLSTYLKDLRISRPNDRVNVPANIALVFDVWVLIVEKIPLEDLVKASMVCKDWHQAIHSALYNAVANLYVGGSSNPFPSKYPYVIGYRFWNARPQAPFRETQISLPTVHPLFNPYYQESKRAEKENKTDFRVGRWEPSPSVETIQSGIVAFFHSEAYQKSRVLSYLLPSHILRGVNGGIALLLKNPNLQYLCLDHTMLESSLEESSDSLNITTLSFVNYHRLENPVPEQTLQNLLSWINKMPHLETLDITCLTLPANYRTGVLQAALNLQYLRGPKL